MIRFVILIAAICSLWGCAANRPANNPTARSTESAALYRQALAALDEHRFIIEVDEFYLKSGQPSVSSTDSFISLRNDRLTARYSPKLFPRNSAVEHLTIDDTAALIPEKSRKNNEQVFRLKPAGGDPSWLNTELLITIFEGTNKCFVQVGRSGGMRFTGYIYPLK